MSITYFTRGSEHLDSRQFEEAVSDFRKALDLNPDDEGIETSLAEALAGRGLGYVNNGNLDDAIPDLKDAIGLDKSNLEYKRALGTVYLGKGLAASESEDYVSAIEYYTEAAKWRLNDPDVYTARGFAYRSIEDNDNAINDLERALRFDSDNKGRKSSLALVYGLRGYERVDAGQYRDALLDAEKAVSLAPDDFGGYALKGIVHFHLREIEKAIANLEKALEIDPTRTDLKETVVNLKTLLN